jgi:hypothetical protein
MDKSKNASPPTSKSHGRSKKLDFLRRVKSTVKTWWRTGPMNQPAPHWLQNINLLATLIIASISLYLTIRSAKQKQQIEGLQEIAVTLRDISDRNTKALEVLTDMNRTNQQLLAITDAASKPKIAFWQQRIDTFPDKLEYVALVQNTGGRDMKTGSYQYIFLKGKKYVKTSVKGLNEVQGKQPITLGGSIRLGDMSKSDLESSYMFLKIKFLDGAKNQWDSTLIFGENYVDKNKWLRIRHATDTVKRNDNRDYLMSGNVWFDL